MAIVCDLKSTESLNIGQAPETENPDLEEGEIDDDDDEIPPETNDKNETTNNQILPAPVPVDTNIFPHNEPPAKEKKKHSSDRKSEKHLTEAEKCVRMLHKMERAERERRERMRREQMADDWAGNVEKAIANVLKKDKHNASAEEDDDEEKKRGRKRKKKERERKKKHRKVDSPKNEEIDEDEMMNIRGASPENKPHKENSPLEEAYDSYDSEYDSESFHNRQQNKRNFDRDRKRRNREPKRDRKNFRDKNRKKENEAVRPQMQDANSLCVFYMQGKCHKGDDCTFSHDALPPMKMELCKFYLMDCCAKRDKCLYMHSEFPCKYYHTGLKCFAKDNCKFAHGKPLTDNLKQILLKHLETAPKEILGDFPRLSREGAQNMVNQTQKNLELQYGIKNGTATTTEKPPGIPSLFDITVPIPPEIMQQQHQQTATEENKPKTNDKPEKPTKVRHTRWNDEPAVPVIPLLNQTFVGGMGSAFNSLNLQDQQKIQEYQLNYQLKGFYSEQDQDMRINSNGDVDMRALPQILPKSDTSINYEQFQQENNQTIEKPEPKRDVDIRNFINEPNLTIPEEAYISKNDVSAVSRNNNQDFTSDININLDTSLTIDEKSIADVPSDLPSTLPKKQRELFLRIQAQQKENIPENQHSNPETPLIKDDDWYSSDDDNDPLSKMVIHLEDEPKEDEEEPEKCEERILSPPTIKPVEVIDKLGDLSKIDISAEVTKLLSSIKTNQLAATSSSASEVKKSRDPRQAKNLDMEIKSPVLNSDPRTKTGKIERRETRTSIYEQGYMNADESRLSIYEQGAVAADTGAKGDVDLRNLDALPKDLDMRPTFGDTDLRQSGRQDVDLRQLGLQFKGIQNYTPATEIDASIGSHSPMTYKVHVVDVPRPDYSGLKLNPQDAQVNSDPRLRKIFRIPSVEEKDSPASPKQQTTPSKPVRQDPRRRNLTKDTETPKMDVSNLSYSQQLHLLQSSAFYQSLTSNQKLMLNQEIASKGDQNASNDPILAGILSSLGLIPSVTNTNGCAMNILANVNSLVPAMNPAMMVQNLTPTLAQNIPGMPPNMNQNIPPNLASNMGQTMAPNIPPNLAQNIPNMPQTIPQNMGGNIPQTMGQNLGPNMAQGMIPINPNVPNPNIPGMTPNLGPGLLGPAPAIAMGPNMTQNEFQINFDPRNGGLLGQAPFQNFPENQNFQYNEEFYPNNEENNFSGGNNNNNNNNSYSSRNDRNFRNERNSQNNRRGRSWNNRHNNNRNYNRNNNRNRSNRSYTPP